MAEQIVIEVNVNSQDAAKNLGELNASISALKQANAELKKQISAGNDEFGENSQKVAENTKALKMLEASAKSLTGQIQTQNKSNEDLGDSFYEMNAAVVQLEKEYKSLTKAQRESVEGQALKKQLIEQKEALKQFDAELGNHQRNVGNYPGSLGKVDAALGKVGTSINGLASGGMPAFKNAMNNGTAVVKSFGKVLLTTPIGWIAAGIAGLIAVFGKLSDAIKKNDDASTNMSRLYDVTVKPVVHAITNAFSFLADIIGKVAGKMADLIGGGRNAANALQSLTVETDKLEEAERTYAKNKAKRERDIAELREKAADEEQYSLAERKKALQEAQELEEQNLQEAINIASKRLELEKQRNKEAQDTSDAAKDRETDLQVALTQLETEHLTRKRKYTKELAALGRKEAKEAEKTNDDVKASVADRDEKEDEAAKKEEERIKRIAALRRELDEAQVAAMEEGIDKELALIDLRTEKEIEALRNRYAQKQELTDEEEQLLADLIAQKEAEREVLIADAVAKDVQKNKEANDKKAEADKAAADAATRQARERAKNALDAANGFLDAASSLLDAFGSDEKERAEAEKAIAIGKAAVASGIAIAEGVAQSQSVPFPANIAAVATTVATVAANIATAVQSIKSARFDTGGIVGGTSYTGDQVPVRVNSGEMILNREQQTQLFDIANGGLYSSSLDNLTAALSAAVASMPSPVMVYSEYNDFKSRTATYNENAKL